MPRSSSEDSVPGATNRARTLGLDWARATPSYESSADGHKTEELPGFPCKRTELHDLRSARTSVTTTPTRFLTPSFLYKSSECWRTTDPDRPRWAAISELLMPRQMHWATSRCRFVSPSATASSRHRRAGNSSGRSFSPSGLPSELNNLTLPNLTRLEAGPHRPPFSKRQGWHRSNAHKKNSWPDFWRGILSGEALGAAVSAQPRDSSGRAWVWPDRGLTAEAMLLWHWMEVAWRRRLRGRDLETCRGQST